MSKASTAKIAIWYTISNIFVKGVVFITTPIFTRLLTKAEYGVFCNFTSWESIFVILLTLDFSASIARAKYDYDGQINSYISTILLASNIVTLFSYIAVEFYIDFFEELLALDKKYIRLLFLNLFFAPAFSYLQNKYRLFQEYKSFVFFSLLSVLSQIGVSLLFVYALPDKLLGRLLGYVMPLSFVNFILWMLVLYKGKSFNWDYIKYAGIISLPLIPHALSNILLGNSDRIMIMKYCGAEETALYSLAYQLSMLANIIWVSMNQAWAPWLYDNINMGNYNAINKNSKIYLGIFCIIVIYALLFTPELLLIMGGEKYYEAKYLMPPIILSCAFQFVYGMYVNLEIYKKQTFMISIGTISATIINILLNYLLIPVLGYQIAAYTTLIGYCMLFVFHYYIVKKKVYEFSSLYDKRFIFGVLLVLSVFSLGTLALYSQIYIRYIVLLLFSSFTGILFYKYRKTIIYRIINK